MARKLIYEVVLDSAAYTRQIKKVQAETAGFAAGMKKTGRETEHLARGVAVGSGAFRSLGRSLAFASGGFIGAAGFTEAVRGSIDAAETLGKASRGLTAQLKANGDNAAQAAILVGSANEKMAGFGHTAADSEDALSRLARATGSVAKATPLMTLTANLAAARQISLQQAAVLVGKVFDGNVSALNRYGIQIAKGTSSTAALGIAQQRLAGQAAAGVTPLEKLHASVTNLEAGVGEALLPTINKVADSLNRWISNSKNQARVTRDVHQAVTVATQGFHALEDIIKVLTPVFQGFSKAVGGTKNALEILIALGAAAKVAKIASSLGLVGSKAGVAEGGVRSLSGSLIGKAGLAGAAGVASFELTTLALKATGLDKKLRSAGGGAYDLAASLGLIHDPTKQFAGKTLLSQPAATFIRHRAQRLEAGGLSTSATVSRILATHPSLARHDVQVLAGQTATVVVHTHVDLDGREVAKTVTKHQARDGNRTPRQTSGRRG